MAQSPRRSVTNPLNGPQRPGDLPALRIAAARSVLLLAFIAGACATRTAETEPGPVLPELEAEAIAATAPDRPLRLLFDWTAREQDGRFRGQGVARLEPPHRARLDLFGPRGEGYLTAALVQEDVRLPAVAPEMPVPAASLLWSVVGVFWPPAGAQLTATRRVGDRTTLEYLEGQARWRFRLEQGRLRSAEWERPGVGRRSVELRRLRPDGLPAEVAYRDWTEYRELVLTLDRVEDVEPFPVEIWTPGSP